MTFHVYLCVAALVCWRTLAQPGDGVFTAKIGVILPKEEKYLFSIRKCVPAIDIGIEEAYRRGYLDKSRVQFNITYEDSECNGVAAPLASFNFKTAELADIFFGPCCDYSLAPVARYAKVWNMPVITSGGLASDFTEKFTGVAEYGTLTRVGPNFAALSKAALRLLEYNHWVKVKLMYDPDGQNQVSKGMCHLAVSGLISKLLKAKVEHEYYKMDPKNLNGTEGRASADGLLKKQGHEFAGTYAVHMLYLSDNVFIYVCYIPTYAIYMWQNHFRTQKLA